jgi:hypothetical protein
MRLKKGTLSDLSKETGFAAKYISDLVSTRIRPGRDRALKLEQAAKKIGMDIPAMLWLYGSCEEIKQALSDDCEQAA